MTPDDEERLAWALADYERTTIARADLLWRDLWAGNKARTDHALARLTNRPPPPNPGRTGGEPTTVRVPWPRWLRGKRR